MKAGELFIELGLKGADKAVAGLQATSKEIGVSVTSALLLKDVLVGIARQMVEIGRTTLSDAFGFVNFNAVTGASIKNLQQVIYQSKLLKMSAEQVTSALTAMSMKFLKPESAGILQFFNAGGVGFNLLQAQRDPTYILKKLQELFQRNPYYGKLAAEFAGASSFIPGLARGFYTPEKLSQAPTAMEKDIKILDNFGMKLRELTAKIEVALIPVFSELVQVISKDVIPIFSDIMSLLVPVFKALWELVKMTGIGKILELWNGSKDWRRDMDQKIDDLVHKGIEKLNPEKSTPNVLEKISPEKLAPPKENFPGANWPIPPPWMKPEAGEINQSFNFNGNVTDPTQVMDAARNGASLAFQQFYGGRTQVT